MKFKIHHVAISVIKLKETIVFYKEIFGFKEYCKYQDEKLEIWLLELEGIKLEVFYCIVKYRLFCSHKIYILF